VSFADSTPANTLVTTSGGNVGIGTSSPAQKVDVVGTQGRIRLDPSNVSGVCVINFTDVAAANFGVGALSASEIRFNTNGSERARIDSSGNLLVGTTSSWSNGGVVINGTGNRGLIIGSSSVYRQQYMDTVNGIMYWFNGSNQASLTSAGAWTNASDAKLKKEITTIKYGLDTVLSTQPRSYKRVDVEGDYIGFVAQELKEKIPEVVFGSDTVQYSVDYGSLVAVAFKAIQEQQALIASQSEIISAQQTALTALTARVEALEGAQA
jgi:hypothetical protein